MAEVGAAVTYFCEAGEEKVGQARDRKRPAQAGAPSPITWQI